MHKQIFSNFIKELNNSSVNYVILRGFGRLPHSPDSDIDLACHIDDWDKFNQIAMKHLSKDPKEPFENYGFAEYCEMIYHPYFTPGPKDRNISNGCFRVDSYNSIYFSSPFNNFTSFWTVPFKFNNDVFASKIEMSCGDYNVYIPCPEHEVTLLVLRSVLDIIGWKRKKCKEKHKQRIKHLLKQCDEERLKKELSKVLPPNDLVIECVKTVDLHKLYNNLIGEFNNGINRR
tara:strand:- start:590 stop:1282 length:693 start_codon:yes stop_codon:yes gene_type:complete